MHVAVNVGVKIEPATKATSVAADKEKVDVHYVASVKVAVIVPHVKNAAIILEITNA